MLVCIIIELLEGVEAFGQICSQVRGVIVSDGRIILEELVLVIVRKACYFLRTV